MKAASCLFFAQLAPALAATLLVGCASVTAVQLPSINPSAALESYQAHVGDEPALSEAQTPVRWWELFNDTTLSAIESELGQSLDIQTATLRVEESRAQLGLADAPRYPTLALAGGYSRSAISENSPTHRLGAPTSGQDMWSLGLQAGWELDLWGHLSHTKASAQSRVDAAYYGRDAVLTAVSADVARSYLLLRGVQAQASLVEKNLQIGRDLIRMAESRERNGAATRFDAASARADAAGLEARLTQLNHRRHTLMNTLALLLGKPPRELDERLTFADLPSMPSRLPIGVPSELARKRPDILQAEARLRAAVADIDAAKADFYPRIGLTGALGAQAFDLSDLGIWGSRHYSIGPTLYLPIFEGGRLSSQLALSETRHRLAGIAYQQVVLRAWHEVNNALGAYASERKRHDQLQRALKQSEIALGVAQRSYQEGSADFTAVLVARRSLLANQAELSDCATASALAVVSLYRALGGGWSAQWLGETTTNGASS